MFLSELNTGESAIILKVKGHGGFRRRIMEMGFVRNKRVKVLLNAPLQDPIKYEIMGYEISLRRSEASMIEVITEEEAKSLISADKATTTYSKDSIEEVITQRNREINVAIVGNPNSGKTSLFNAISGSHEHVGNYSGVTVDAKKGECRYRGYNFIITDLPGTYALSAYTPEERYVREHLQNESPDVVINTVVASNLERNLYLTTELID
ncbi:MAG: 50S ribosome-binding GTPase, partial [Coprobacter sp.]|nr:50S ribosome-binding GTPase [Coprobacter sp.]